MRNVWVEVMHRCQIITWWTGIGIQKQQKRAGGASIWLQIKCFAIFMFCVVLHYISAQLYFVIYMNLGKNKYTWVSKYVAKMTTQDQKLINLAKYEKSQNMASFVAKWLGCGLNFCFCPKWLFLARRLYIYLAIQKIFLKVFILSARLSEPPTVINAKTTTTTTTGYDDN